MKRHLLIPVLLLTSLAFARTEAPLSASALLMNAEASAKAHHKNVLVTFHASWCGWCKQLDKTFARPDVKPIIEKNFEVVAVTILESKDKKSDENPGGVDVLTQVGGNENGGIPFYAILTPDGKLLANSNASSGGKPAANIGYPGEPNEIDHFMRMMDKGAPHFTKGDREALRKALSERASEIHAAQKARQAQGH